MHSSRRANKETHVRLRVPTQARLRNRYRDWPLLLTPLDLLVLSPYRFRLSVCQRESVPGAVATGLQFWKLDRRWIWDPVVTTPGTDLIAGDVPTELQQGTGRAASRARLHKQSAPLSVS